MISRVLLATVLSLSAGQGALAQETPSPEEAAAEPTHFAVIGLAPDDLLNLRATASATGMLIGRLSQGVLVKNLGCAEVSKVQWCKVADMDDEKVQGWAAARYLQPAEGPPVDDIGPVGEELDQTQPDAPEAKSP